MVFIYIVYAYKFPGNQNNQMPAKQCKTEKIAEKQMPQQGERKSRQQHMHKKNSIGM